MNDILYSRELKKFKHLIIQLLDYLDTKRGEISLSPQEENIGRYAVDVYDMFKFFFLRLERACQSYNIDDNTINEIEQILIDTIDTFGIDSTLTQLIREIKTLVNKLVKYKNEEDY